MGSPTAGTAPHVAARSTQQHTGPRLVDCVAGVPDSEVDTARKCSALALKWSEGLQSAQGRTLTPHEVAVLAAETSVGIAPRQGPRRLAVNGAPRGAGTRPPSQTQHPNHHKWVRRLATDAQDGLVLTRANPNPNPSPNQASPSPNTAARCGFSLHAS